ncbi:phenylalanine--tRNA ligase subunit beta [Motilimonas cestriensis]|uniref:Phenylalanine--tRNA ligase beta subunit n=1 Tax=Motilimonas cestriensis TaxID=2742685 RepID=A0ABS8W863_9GAMM|nr:phenylalanine--tRNA ligase subunit beta [Motilimonas cestriensis]MCE2595192.1 phenylalanine--tRNA ligase subunit beta [Motilimonas cestriensis]
MKFSESWLREWVNPAIDTDALSEQITMAGLEVDGVEPVAKSFTNVVVGHVVECGKHPEADKLQVTKIDVGDAELIDIVCGAANCRQGLKVAVAKVGAVLPGDFKIKKAKLRGQPSMGMLCSLSELGMAESADGILELPSDAPIGTCVREYLALEDVTIDVDLTPNRADCLGIKGLAREVGVLNNLDVTVPSWQEAPVTIEDSRDVELVNPEACPRYLGRVIKGINLAAETPLWMVEKLRRCGVRSIDPVVDITNFVLLEFGHPMHAFDLAKIDGGIKVRLANEGESLTLLDGNEVELNNETLVIADNSKALAMAGIFGGLDSGVTSETADIFLESAFFAPLAITGRARHYGLHTDASHRYERGVDPELQAQAMSRATALIADICGGEVGPVVEAVSEAHLPKPTQITLRRAKLDKIIGIHINDQTVGEILGRLGFSVEEQGSDWLVSTPTYRFDMAIEEDLIEEVARVFGYNSIPNKAPIGDLSMATHHEAKLPLARLRDTLVGLDYQEAITYSFVDPSRQALLFPESDPLILPNPISTEMSAMRVSLWTGLLDAVAYNQSRQQNRVRLFESGLRFTKDESAENGVLQQPMLAGVITGKAHDEHWDLPSRPADFFDLKGDLEAILELTVDRDRFSFEPTEHSALHPGQAAAIYRDGVLVGFIGAIHPQFEKKLGLNGRTIVFELELDKVVNRQLPAAKPVSKYPANSRDIALVVEETVESGKIIKFIQKIGGNQLVGVNLFDVYQGKGIEEGFKSLAINLVLQDTARTLEEKEIADAVESIVVAVKSEFNASLRD